MNLKSLQDKIRQDRAKADSMRADATRAAQAASGFSGIGDTTRAESERNNADKYADQIRDLEQAIADNERLILTINQQVQSLDRDKNAAEAELKRTIDDIEKAKLKLTGGSSALF